MENQTLYCFKMSENGEIKKTEIKEWVRRNQSEYTERYIISFDNKKYQINKSEKIYRMSSEKLGRFVSDKLFTFNPDEKEAYRKIKKEIKEKADKAKKIYDEAMEEYVKITCRRAKGE